MGLELENEKNNPKKMKLWEIILLISFPSDLHKGAARGLSGVHSTL